MKRTIRRMLGMATMGWLVANALLAQMSSEEKRLLADTNLFATAPQQFRARLAVNSVGSSSRVELEIWRGGRDQLLVRPLDPKQAGKFLLQTGADRYLISPGAKQPVKLGAGFKMQGGLSFEELLGIDLERSYDVERVETTGRVVTFHLKARPETAAASGTAAARWVVDRERRLPLRADLLLADGRTARVIEFPEFRHTRPLVPRRVVLKDVLRGGAPLEVELREFQAGAVPAGLFDLADTSARNALPAPPAGP
jgi:hypothetical protein